MQVHHKSEDLFAQIMTWGKGGTDSYTRWVEHVVCVTQNGLCRASGPVHGLNIELKNRMWKSYIEREFATQKHACLRVYMLESGKKRPEIFVQSHFNAESDRKTSWDFVQFISCSTKIHFVANSPRFAICVLGVHSKDWANVLITYWLNRTISTLAWYTYWQYKCFEN